MAVGLAWLAAVITPTVAVRHRSCRPSSSAASAWASSSPRSPTSSCRRSARRRRARRRAPTTRSARSAACSGWRSWRLGLLGQRLVRQPQTYVDGLVPAVWVGAAVVAACGGRGAAHPEPRRHPGAADLVDPWSAWRGRHGLIDVWWPGVRAAPGHSSSAASSRDRSTSRWTRWCRSLGRRLPGRQLRRPRSRPCPPRAAASWTRRPPPDRRRSYRGSSAAGGPPRAVRARRSPQPPTRLVLCGFGREPGGADSVS